MTIQTIETGRMPATAVVELLGELIPRYHELGLDNVVEALSEAIDALDWLPLHRAPRDGTWIQLAIAPHHGFGLEGFVCFGRWIIPEAARALSSKEQSLFDRHGGWWSSSRHEKPFKRPVLAWRPLPAVDFAWLERQQRDPDWMADREKRLTDFLSKLQQPIAERGVDA